MEGGIAGSSSTHAARQRDINSMPDQSILHGLFHTLYRHRTVLWILEPPCCSYQAMGNAVWSLWLRKLFNFHQEL
jgi:hypothetical protein